MQRKLFEVTFERVEDAEAFVKTSGIVVESRDGNRVRVAVQGEYAQFLAADLPSTPSETSMCSHKALKTCS